MLAALILLGLLTLGMSFLFIRCTGRNAPEPDSCNWGIPGCTETHEVF